MYEWMNSGWDNTQYGGALLPTAPAAVNTWIRGADMAQSTCFVPDITDRFWSRVDRSGGPDACWPWTGPLNWGGYGFASGGKAHRVAYRAGAGPLAKGQTLDHVCHNRDPLCPGNTACLHRRCCNPTHLEPVTQTENVRRGAARTGMCRAGLHPKPTPGRCQACWKLTRVDHGPKYRAYRLAHLEQVRATAHEYWFRVAKPRRQAAAERRRQEKLGP